MIIKRVYTIKRGKRKKEKKKLFSYIGGKIETLCGDPNMCPYHVFGIRDRKIYERRSSCD